MQSPNFSTNIFLNKELQQDNIFVDAYMKPLSELTGLKADSKLKNAIVSEGKIVSVVSGGYQFMDNRKFFYDVEANLINAGINYATRSINRGDKHFAVDYILSDESYHVNIKGGDLLTPMLRFTNSYAGLPSTGHFGFFRKVCDNGLHVAKMKVGFYCLHRGKQAEVVFPAIKELVGKFMDNEFYSLHKKFQVLAETPITDLKDFVKYTCTKLDLFRYEASEKNPDTPSKNAELIMNTINNEARILGTEPNMWLGYNAFNEYVHGGGKTFGSQKKTDIAIFNTVLEHIN